ncbi:MAG: hypothetical protein Q8N46_11935 [Anaerolineales bacterium]|nr:hypothetical protein [Anaerolineales bacterium]
MTGPISTGTCNLCGKDFAKNAITRHLKKCLQEQAAASTGGKTQKTFWINVWGTYLPDYWLHLEVPASAKLADLDQFLRDIWLECCGHLSAFAIGDTRYELDTGMVDAMWKDFFGPSQPPKSMNARLYTVLKPGLKFDHEYDFGTTTELSLTVVAEQERADQSKEIRVLARNNPPDIHCAKCGKPATRVCSQCIYEGPKAWLCEQHAERHKCGEDMFLPVVNSPRVGQCGYTGGADLGAEF